MKQDKHIDFDRRIAAIFALWSYKISEDILAEENLGFMGPRKGQGNLAFLCVESQVQMLAFFFMKIHNVSIIAS